MVWATTRVVGVVGGLDPGRTGSSELVGRPEVAHMVVVVSREGIRAKMVDVALLLSSGLVDARPLPCSCATGLDTVFPPHVHSCPGIFF